MKRRYSISKVIFTVVSYTTISLFSLACLLPFLLILIASFTSERSLLVNGFNFYIPAGEFSLKGYAMIFQYPEVIFRAYVVTIFVTVVGTLLSMFMVTMTGYVLSRRDFPWNNKFSFFFYFTTLFNGGLVPWYLLCTKTLHFSNHIYALILPGLLSVFNMIIAKSFIKNLPFELTESAKIDGAGDFRIYYQIILPICKPLLATLTLFVALAYWNDWYHSMLFMNDSNMYSLQYFLQKILNSMAALTIVAEQSGMDVKQLPMESMKMGMLMIAIGPMMFLYPFLQKYFVKGLTIGAIKG